GGAARDRAPHDASGLEVYASAPTLRFAHSVSYRSRLRGAEDGWRITSDPRVRIPRLAPGRYTFEQGARIGAGPWSEPVRVPFEILPPWWQSWWCYVLEALGLGLILRLMMRWRFRRFDEQKHLLALAVDLRTHDLREQQTRTEQQKKEIEKLLVQAQEANRHKSEFLANVSHEIRTPLNAVLGMTSLTLGTELTGEQREYLELTRDSGESLLVLINDILDFSKIEAGRLQLDPVEFSLRRSVEQVMAPQRLKAKSKGLEFRCRFDDAVPDDLFGDPGRLGQVLLNLVGNALKFTERGEVEVTVALVSREVDQVVLRFAVRDTGIGIPAEKHKLIFESFQQADGSMTRKFGGTGLGLTISCRLAALMNGRIWVESEPGKGSTFFLEAGLVVRASAPTDTASLTRLSASVSHTSARILVAEDNPINQRLIRRILERRGHTVTLAANGNEAL
ncbi:MAG: ATP-binding protein, partial [Bryobacteraceae bacterium]